MTALGEWLKQLILIVLFAVFAEMLMPTKALERYIRMVLGLALIATMLQPLGILLQKDWASQLAEQAAAELTQTPSGSTAVTDSNTNLTDLEKSLTHDRNTEANTLLANQIGQGILEKFGIRPQSVVVEGAGSQGQLQVHVVLASTQMSRASPVSKWIGSELGLNQADIVVNTNGGG